MVEAKKGKGERGRGKGRKKRAILEERVLFNAARLVLNDLPFKMKGWL